MEKYKVIDVLNLGYGVDFLNLSKDGFALNDDHLRKCIKSLYPRNKIESIFILTHPMFPPGFNNEVWLLAIMENIGHAFKISVNAYCRIKPTKKLLKFYPESVPDLKLLKIQ